MYPSILGSALMASAIAWSCPSTAATLNHVISFGTTGTPGTAIIDITIDTNVIEMGVGKTAGLTVNSVNFLLDDPIFYANPDFSFGAGSLFLYGATNTSSTGSNTNDLSLVLRGFGTTAAFATNIFLVQGAQGFITSSGTGTVLSADITANPVPLPASLPLLVLATGLFGMMRRRRRKMYL